MPFNDALTPVHTRAPDVDKLSIFGEQLPDRFSILGVECRRERVDDFPRLVKSGHRDRLIHIHVQNAAAVGSG